LLNNLQEEVDIDRRAEIIRKLGECPTPEVIKTLWTLRNNIESEDPFVQYEINLSLHKLLKNPDINISFFLANFEIFQPREENKEALKMLIDGNTIEEFFLRDNQTFKKDFNKLMRSIFNGKINPYIGKDGLTNVWNRIQEIKRQEEANRLILELLSKLKVCQIDLKEIDLNKYPTVNIPTIIQVEIARKYGLDGIITLRDRDFNGSNYPFVYSPAFFVQSLEHNLSPEEFKEKITKKTQAKMIEKLSILLQGETSQTGQQEPNANLLFEEKLPLFKGWKIEQFEILCSQNNLTSATVIICHEDGQSRHQESAFQTGSINALFTAFDKALSHIVEIKHQLQSIYIANLEPGKEGSVTAKSIVKYGTEEVTTIYTHKNIIKAYFFAYLKAIIAIYAPDEYLPDNHNEQELMSLYRIGRRNFSRLNFSHVDLRDRDNEANLSDAILKECDLSHANLSCMNLTKADLTGAILSHANLSHANLTEANLTDIRLDESNQTLFKGTILTNTTLPEIKLTISGEPRIHQVIQLLNQMNVTKDNHKIVAVHSMITPEWWNSDQGRRFWEVNQELVTKGIPIQRVFILPEYSTNEHLIILEEQKKSGVEVRFLCHFNAQNIDCHDWSKTNLMVVENISVARNSFTTRMIINEKDENGYISFQSRNIKTDKEMFTSIWEKAEVFEDNEVVCANNALTEL
ncbi:pentapeptide repeat-containing protein, partial [Crocosphaera chwakensis]